MKLSKISSGLNNSYRAEILLHAPHLPTSPATKSNSDAGGGDGAHEFSDFITISSDERSNAILVYGTRPDIEEIGRMIESLDQPLPLARIDTIL